MEEKEYEAIRYLITHYPTFKHLTPKGMAIFGSTVNIETGNVDSEVKIWWLRMRIIGSLHKL